MKLRWRWLLPESNLCLASGDKSIPMKKKSRQNLSRLLLLLIVMILTTLVFYYCEQVQRLAHFGYGGIFILSVLTNATLILPLPGVVFTSAMGAVFNPFWVAIAAGCGAAIGETTGYLAGYSGQFVISKEDWYERLTNWMKKYGNLTILLLAIIPNPLFDLVGIAAGVLKLPLHRFIVWCTIGKIIKMLAFAYSGASLLNYFSKF